MIRDVFNELKQTDWRNFFTWSRRVKHSVIMACGVVAWLLSFLFFNLGQYSQLSVAQSKETELKQNLAVTLPKIAIQQQEKQQLQQIDQLIDQQNRLLPKFDQLGPILDDITQASANQRLNLMLLKPNPIITVAPYEAVPIEVEVSGDYAAITHFLNQLARLPYPLYPRQVSLGPPDSGKQQAAESLTGEALRLKMMIDMYYVAPVKPHVKN